MSEQSLSNDNFNIDVTARNKHLHKIAMQILLHRPSSYLHGEFDPSEEQTFSAYEQAITILTVGSEFEYTLLEGKWTPYEGIDAMRRSYKQSQER